MLPSILFLLLPLVSLFTLIQADNEFCGCQAILPSQWINPDAPNGQITFRDGDECWRACYAAVNPAPAAPNHKLYRHSMYQASSGQCACTDRYPQGSAQRDGEKGRCTDSRSWDNRFVTSKLFAELTLTLVLIVSP